MRLAKTFSVISVLSAALAFAACGDKDKPGDGDGKPRYEQGKNKDRAEDLNELLRGELSAVETYNQAINRFGSETGGDDLKRLRSDHEAAVTALRDLVTKAGGTPATSSGGWGAFTKAIEGAAKLFGNDAAFKALEEGEKHGISEYESALKDEDLTPEDKRVVSDTLLPKQRAHVSVLEELRKRV